MYSETWDQLMCLEQTGIWFIQYKLTKISYIGTLLNGQFILDSGLFKVQYRAMVKNMVFNATFNYFSYIMAVSFIDGGSRSTWRKPLTNCIGSCKHNYHTIMIMTMTAPVQY